MKIDLLLESVPDRRGSRTFLDRLRAEAPEAFERIANSPTALQYAIYLSSYSRFLTDSVLRDPERILQVANSTSFHRVLSVEDYQARLQKFLGDSVPTAVDFARFRRRQ